MGFSEGGVGIVLPATEVESNDKVSVDVVGDFGKSFFRGVVTKESLGQWRNTVEVRM